METQKAADVALTVLQTLCLLEGRSCKLRLTEVASFKKDTGLNLLELPFSEKLNLKLHRFQIKIQFINLLVYF